MLPKGYLERLTSVEKIRSFETGHERRKHARIPVSLRADSMRVEREKLCEVTMVRVKDLSASGVGLLMPMTAKLSEQMVLGICPRGFDTHWLLCRVKRAVSFDGICVVVGAIWEKVLYPGQDLQPGLALGSLMWMDVEGDGVDEDPFAETQPLPPHLRMGGKGV